MAKDTTNQPDDEPVGTGGFKEGDPISDWRVINKKAEGDQAQWEEAMKKREAQGLPRIPIDDWLKLNKPIVQDDGGS